MTKPTEHRVYIAYINEGTEFQEDFFTPCVIAPRDMWEDKGIKMSFISLADHERTVQELLDALESIAQTRCAWQLSQEIAKAALTKFREGKAR